MQYDELFLFLPRSTQYQDPRQTQFPGGGGFFPGLVFLVVECKIKLIA